MSSRGTPEPSRRTRYPTWPPPGSGATQRRPGSDGSSNGSEPRRRKARTDAVTAAADASTGTAAVAATETGRNFTPVTVTTACRHARVAAGQQAQRQHPAASGIAAETTRNRTVSWVQTGENTIWVGPEPLRRHLIERGAATRVIDVTGNAPVEQIKTRGFFTDSTHLTGIAECDEKRCKEISEAVKASQERTSGEADKLGKAQERALAETFVIVKLTTRGSARKIAEKLGVNLDNETERTLTDLLSHDPGRLVGTLEALAAGGYTAPSSKQISLLAGSAREEGAPWHLLDLLEKGRPAEELLGTLEAIPTIAFLAKRAMLALYAAEHPDHGIEEATQTLGETSDGAWRGARRMAGKLGPENARLLVRKLLEADIWAKRGKPREALLLAAGHTRKLLNSK